MTKYYAQKIGQDQKICIGESFLESPFSFNQYSSEENFINGNTINSVEDWQMVLAASSVDIYNEREEKLVSKGAFWQLIEDKSQFANNRK